jgi:hypothetical protein
MYHCFLFSIATVIPIVTVRQPRGDRVQCYSIPDRTKVHNPKLEVVEMGKPAQMMQLDENAREIIMKRERVPLFLSTETCTSWTWDGILPFFFKSICRRSQCTMITYESYPLLPSVTLSITVTLLNSKNL